MGDRDLTITPLMYRHLFNKDKQHSSVGYLRTRRSQIKEYVEALQLEADHLDYLIGLVGADLCVYCGGRKEVYFQESQDSGHYGPCPSCDGSGKSKAPSVASAK